MIENKHGFKPKTEFTMGGIDWTIIETGDDWVKCLSSKCVEERAFDEDNNNNFATSSLRAYLNEEFLQKLIGAGAPEKIFKEFAIDLTADDGLKDYGTDRVRIGLITCDEYRALRGNIPAFPDRWWWTATSYSPNNHFARGVQADGTLNYVNTCSRSGGVRPLCVLESKILKAYLDREAKYAEAVDMMKRILAAWNVKPEEAFDNLKEVINKEPEIDWGTVPVDTPVLVKDHRDDYWRRYYFAKYENDRVYTFPLGQTSWSHDRDYVLIDWNYVELAEVTNNDK